MAHVLPRLRGLFATSPPSMRLIEAVAAIDAEMATGFLPLVRDRWRARRSDADATFRMLGRMGPAAAGILDLLQADIESEKRVTDRHSAHVIEEDDAWVRACQRVVDRIAGQS